jgi:hypothetical protein
MVQSISRLLYSLFSKHVVNVPGSMTNRYFCDIASLGRTGGEWAFQTIRGYSPEDGIELPNAIVQFTWPQKSNLRSHITISNDQGASKYFRILFDGALESH